MASRLAVLAKLHDTGIFCKEEDIGFLLSIAKAASQVRIAQKNYYKCKGPQSEKQSLLIESKTKESELDALLAEQAKVTEDLFD